MSGAIRVGTSGWHYIHWRGPFYPDNLRNEDLLNFYARRLGTVEINNSFYHLPNKETFRLWREQSPNDFVFAVKASRYITHMKKLKDPGQAVEKFFSHADELKEKLGPILFQLPPRWRRDTRRLEDFLQALPRTCRHAFEFRDPSWFHSETYALLEKHRAAFCVFDLAGQESPQVLTTEFAYIRLHGPGELKYAGRYTKGQLRRWVEVSEKWLAAGAEEVFVYFDNDQAGYAALNAIELQEMARRAKL